MSYEIAVDLHLHTSYSDGVLSPKDLVNLCYKNGLKHISITDHDCTDGIQESIEIAKHIDGLEVIPGIELSSQNEMHILGYYIDFQDMRLQKILSEFKNDRVSRTQEPISVLKKLGININWNVVKSFAGEGTVGRPHIAKAMISGGYVKSFKEAFDTYLGKDGLAYTGKVKMTPKEEKNISIDQILKEKQIGFYRVLPKFMQSIIKLLLYENQINELIKKNEYHKEMNITK